MEEKYITGLTSDIDDVIREFQSKNKETNLVFQQHFDDINQARSFEEKIKDWDDAKKEALIQGEHPQPDL